MGNLLFSGPMGFAYAIGFTAWAALAGLSYAIVAGGAKSRTADEIQADDEAQMQWLRDRLDDARKAYRQAEHRGDTRAKGEALRASKAAATALLQLEAKSLVK